MISKRTYKRQIARFTAILIFLLCAVNPVLSEIRIVFDTSSPQLRFAAGKLENVILNSGESMNIRDIAGPEISGGNIYVISGHENLIAARKLFPGLRIDPSIGPEGYSIEKIPIEGHNGYAVMAGDENGAMYGLLDLRMQYFKASGLHGIHEKIVNPRFQFRAIKFNLPWSPYRPGKAAEIHLAVCRDPEFWRRFLDMMAENRFNVLSLWNLHPFTFMIRPENFPLACPFDEHELNEWKSFWKNLFRMAKERGIETYLVNWNIVVSPGFAEAYGATEKNDTSETVRKYTRECVTQVINEYEDLTGLGVTLADWMNDMTPKEREDWILETFIEGMKRASRPIKFIHRSVLAGSPLEMRRVIDAAALPDPVWVEVKFNWSHGHSTPRLSITHDYASGEIDQRFWYPRPLNYKIAWMIRNEDFFVLRWGEPEFIRKHIMTNGKDYVGGYFVGSEGYIPAMDYSHRLQRHRTWQYAFEKQWLYYTLWGNLLYNPDITDEEISREFDLRYPAGNGSVLLRAHTLAGRMPLRLASFHAGTWDYTLYAEGFCAPRESRGLFDGISSFISIDEFIQHETLDPSYMSIPKFVAELTAGREIPEGTITPLNLAEDCERDARELLNLLGQLRKSLNPLNGAIECELSDLECWAYLGHYLSCKLRGGVALERYRMTGNADFREKAVEVLKQGAEHWKAVSGITDSHYSEMPYVSGESFSWSKYYDQVLRDIRLAEEARPLR